VTVVNGIPFHFRRMLEGDNGAILAAATQLRKKDEVHFLSEDEHPSLLALMWILGWPVVLLVLALIGRLGAVRVGMAGLLLILIVVQNLLVRGPSLVAALHPLNAVAILLVSLDLARRSLAGRTVARADQSRVNTPEQSLSRAR